MRISLFVQNCYALYDSFTRHLENMQIVVPTSNRVVFGEEELRHEHIPTEYDWGELAILHSEARILSSQLNKRVTFRSEQVQVWT